jgi:chromate transporter
VVLPSGAAAGLTVLAKIAGVFGLLSLLAVGGGLSVLPEMKRLTVLDAHWLTGDQFVDLYSLGQMAPGPNMNMVLLIGLQAAGVAGAAIAWLGFFLPSSVLALVAGRGWQRLSGWPWRESIRRGLAPVTIGLMTAGVISLARSALLDARAIGLAVLAGAVLLPGRVNPVLVIAACGAAGWFIFG